MDPPLSIENYAITMNLNNASHDGGALMKGL
jgi:hypothetical protein